MILGNARNTRTKHLVKKILLAVALVTLLTMPSEMASLNVRVTFMRDSPLDLPKLAAENPRLNLSYYSNDDPVERPVSSGSRLSGDRVTLVASWTPALVSDSRLEIIASAIPATLVEHRNSSIIEIDTRALGNNATCFINSTAWLTNGSIMSVTFSDVFIGNFFVPKVTVISPNGGETWTGVNNITWIASDLNAGESLRFDVFISNDSGVSYVPLAEGISDTYLEWNSTGLDMLPTYVAKVRATDGIYFSHDTSDSPFTAGDVVLTTTTTPVSTTTTTTPPDDEGEPRVIAFIVILLTSSTIMALIVYYAAKKWF